MQSYSQVNHPSTADAEPTSDGPSFLRRVRAIADSPTVLQWMGAFTGVAGTALLAGLGWWSKYGFVLYLLSNACWIRYGLLTRAPGLTVQNIAFTVASAVGLWNWFRVTA